MKKLTKMIALAIGLVTVAFSGCKNILSDATIAGEELQQDLRLLCMQLRKMT